MSGPSPFDPPPAGEPLPLPSPWRPLAYVFAALLMAVLTWLWISDPIRWRVGSGLLVIPLLVLLSVPFVNRARRFGASFDIGALIVVAMLVRFLALFYRYDHRLDAGRYHFYGSQLAEAFRGLRFDADPGAPIPGTGGQRWITGVIEVFTNTNEFATFLTFTWLGFLGCYFFYEAFVTALPDGDRRRYALLIFLWPTLIFWPSSISKDGWMIFTVGLASVGIARVLVRRRGGYALFAVGALLASVVRPHVAMLAVVAFGFAMLVGRRRRPGRPGFAAGVASVAGFVALLAVGALLANQVGDFLEARDLSVDSAISENTENTLQGGSAFEPANPQNPLGYARATITILFRPFPNEASGMEQLVTALEAMFLAGLCVVSWRRLASVPFRLRRDPYVMYAVAMILMLIFVLGTIGNFGILARQRSQVIPFVFVPLCVFAPPPKPKRGLRVARDARAT